MTRPSLFFLFIVYDFSPLCQIPLHSIVKFLYTLTKYKKHNRQVISRLHILARGLLIYY